MLPDYLKYKTDGTCEDSQVVLCGDCRFTVLTNKLLRIEQGEFCDRATLSVINRKLDKAAFCVSESNGVLTLQTEDLRLEYKVGTRISAETLSVTLLGDTGATCKFGQKPLHNLGGTVTTLDEVNGAIPIDDGICSLDGFAWMDDSKTPCFDDNGWFIPRTEGIIDSYFFGYGHRYSDCVKDYYRLTGVPQMLPAFVFGNWWSRYYKYTEESYLNLMDRFQQNDVPISVGIVDMDWHLTDGDGRDYRTDGWTGYTWNKKYFPQPYRFVEQLHQCNLKTALNLHPQSGVRHWEEQYRDVAEDMGFDFNAKETVPFRYVDPKMWKTYFERLLFPMEEKGIDFWWMDWQEQFDYEKPVGHALERMSPLWMLNHMHYLAAIRNGKRGLIFSRYGGFGSQRYPIGFSGDTIISWESLDFQPYFTVTASNVGYSYWSHDIGGHMGGYRDDELNVRWIQFGVFSPIFRLHSTDNIFTGREPWNYNPRAEAVLTDFMRLRHRLFPYLYTMCYRNYRDLIPLMQPMYHLYPEEKVAYGVKNQYFFGSELMVAPITRKADAASTLGSADVWFPKGVWIDWFTGDVYCGEQSVRVFRPMEQMPVFCKGGAIVPLQAHKEKDNHLGGTEHLTLCVAAGNNGSFTLYEDDGETMNYQKEDFCTSEFNLAWGENRAVFTKLKSAGNLAYIPNNRTYTLVFKGFSAKCAFFLNGESILACYNEKTHEYEVSVPNVTGADGFEVTVESDQGLIYENLASTDKILDIITKAQTDLAKKDRLYQSVTAILQKTKTDFSELVSDETDQTPQAVIEQLKLLGYKE